MAETLSETRSPTVASTSGEGYPLATWSNPTNVFAADSSSATVGLFEGGMQSEVLSFSGFGFDLPSGAVIEGVQMTVVGSQFSAYGSVNIVTDTLTGTAKDALSLATSYGGSDDLWDLALTVDDINDSSFGGTVFMGDISGGDGSAEVDHAEITVYYHIAAPVVAPADVPTRVLYKVFGHDGTYKGLLPNVISDFGFAQDVDTVGSQITIECGEAHDRTRLPTDFLMTEDGDYLVTEDDDYLKTEGQPPIIATGDSNDSSILMKNGNRVEVHLINYYYPNGKLMFKGQINRIEADEKSVKLMVLNDGIDLDNIIARGAPFSYTNDVSHTTGSSTLTVSNNKLGWNYYGQTWVVGGGVTNLGAITVRLRGAATVTVDVYEGAFINLVTSVTQSVNVGSATNVQFALPTLVNTTPGNTYSFAVKVNFGQTITIYYSSTNTYANGSRYNSNFAGGGGGGSYISQTGDLYFITASGTPTTSATYTSKDPVTEMLSPILTDYNLRGGAITEGTFEATGLSLTANFNTNTVYDAIRSVKDMAPNGFYYTVDLGTNELDFKQASTTADFIFVKGTHLQKLGLVMSIENVKNFKLFSGGEVSPGVNLYKQYQDTESMGLYGVRLERKSDNRVTITATANAIGESFIAERKDEEHQTVVTIPASVMDTTLLLPGKMVGFRGFSSFIDSIILRIVRREFSTDSVTLTLGMLPTRMNPKIERITRGLIAEQTVNNPSAPS